MKKQRFDPEVWNNIRVDIDNLNRTELETRFYSLEKELNTIPETKQSLYMFKEFKYIHSRLKMV